VFAADSAWHATCDRSDDMSDDMRRPPKIKARPANVTRADAVDLVALLKILRALQRELERVAGRLADEGEAADALARLFADLVARLSGVAGVTVPPRAARSPEEQGLMDAEAETGVVSLRIARRVDGSGDVSVNGRPPFRLPPKLTLLLAILVAPGPCAADGLLAWRSRAEVANALNKRTGGTASAASVPRLVYKLREAFRDAGENWLLIQRNRERGVRVALRG
jgi:hypothetical protein